MNYSFDDLVKILERLRSENGCPWDKKQTTHSLLPYLLEESYEFIDACEEGDKTHICEELGDVLLQVVFHAQIFKEKGDFSIENVVQGICEKMIRRHPHVFGDAKANTADEVHIQWEKIKSFEKNNMQTEGSSALDKVNKTLPPLARAEDIIRRASKVGFNWNTSEPVFEKAQEEFTEFRAEMQEISENNSNIFRLEEEFGDILFSLANVARTCGFSATIALQKANAKFEKRFRAVEELCQKNGIEMKDVELSKLQEMWRQVKKEEL